MGGLGWTELGRQRESGRWPVGRDAGAEAAGVLGEERRALDE